MTTFVDNSTVIQAVWLNSVDRAVTQAIGTGTNTPTTPSEVKVNLGLDQVNNTSDINKPISINTQTALNLKQDTLPLQATHAGEYLQTNGTDVLWTPDIRLKDRPSLAEYTVVEAEALNRDIFVPLGTFTAAPNTPITSTYHGEGVIKSDQLTYNLLDNQAPQDNIYSTVGDVSTIDAAIQSGSAKVVFWGDSISEGVSQIAYEDSFVGLISGYLTDSAPNIQWSFENYSIAGSAAGDAANAAYVGAATDSYPAQFYRTAGSTNIGNFQPDTSLWPSGSTIAKSWQQHVRDASPDLLVIAFGANDVATSKTAFANSLSSILTYVNGWAKVPSVVFVTNLCPTRETAPWSGYQNQLQNIASITRQIARQNNTSVIDANRLHHVYRDGVDVCRPSKRLSYNFSGGYTDSWPAKWDSSGTSLPNVIGTYNLNFLGPCTTEKTTLERDVSLSAIFTNAAASNSVFGLTYRSAGASSGDKYSVLLVTNAAATLSTCVLYYAGAAVASGIVATVTNGEAVQVSVECIGARHIIKVRGAVSIDTVTFGKMDAGYFGVQWGTGSGTISNWVARVGSYRVVGAPRLTDTVVYGAVNDWITNDASLGGDMIHHPTAVGHYSIYYTAALHFLRHLVLLSHRPKNKIVVGTITDTVTALAANDYIEITIAGSSNGAVFLNNSTADVSLGASTANIQMITGTAAVVNFIKNGVMFMTQTLALSGGGMYAVMASGSVSSKGGIKRHVLSAIAIKV